MKVKLVVREALICAIYFVLTIINPLSYEYIQIRISEALLLLCFFNKKDMVGIILGTILSNLFSPFVLTDLSLGVLATVLSVICMNKCKNYWISLIFPIIFNGLFVGSGIVLVTAMSFDVTYILSVIGFVCLGETISVIIGAILFKLFLKNDGMKRIIYGGSYEKES